MLCVSERERLGTATEFKFSFLIQSYTFFPLVMELGWTLGIVHFVSHFYFRKNTPESTHCNTKWANMSPALQKHCVQPSRADSFPSPLSSCSHRSRLVLTFMTPIHKHPRLHPAVCRHSFILVSLTELRISLQISVASIYRVQEIKVESGRRQVTRWPKRIKYKNRVWSVQNITSVIL